MCVLVGWLRRGEGGRGEGWGNLDDDAAALAVVDDCGLLAPGMDLGGELVGEWVNSRTGG